MTKETIQKAIALSEEITALEKSLSRRHRPHKRRRRARANWEHKWGLIAWMERMRPHFSSILTKEADAKAKKAVFQEIENQSNQ